MKELNKNRLNNKYLILDKFFIDMDIAMEQEYKDDNIEYEGVEEEIDIKKGKCRVKRVEIKMPKIIMDNFKFLEDVEEFIIENDLENTNEDEWETKKEYKIVKEIVELFNEMREGINLIDTGKNKTIPRVAFKLNKLKKLTDGYI